MVTMLRQNLILKKNENVEIDVRFGKNLVYTRKKSIPESTHIQESNPTLPEVTSPDPSSTSNSIFEFSHEQETKSNSVLPPHYTVLYLPISLRKDTRKYTKKSLYLVSNYLSFEHFSLTHKAFLTSLNTIK